MKRHLQRQNSTLICINYIFLGTLLFNFQKCWGGGAQAPLAPPPATDLHERVVGRVRVSLPRRGLGSRKAGLLVGLAITIKCISLSKLKQQEHNYFRKSFNFQLYVRTNSTLNNKSRQDQNIMQFTFMIR